MLLLVCCSVLQCVAVSSRMLQCVAVRCSVLRCVTVCYTNTNRRRRWGSRAAPYFAAIDTAEDAAVISRHKYHRVTHTVHRRERLCVCVYTDTRMYMSIYIYSIYIYTCTYIYTYIRTQCKDVRICQNKCIFLKRGQYLADRALCLA